VIEHDLQKADQDIQGGQRRMKGFGGQRPIFPALAALMWGDHGGFYLGLAYDAPGPFPTIAAALDAVANPKTNMAARGKRTARIRRTTPNGAARREHYTPRRKYSRS
jgi:hypothetical protein